MVIDCDKKNVFLSSKNRCLYIYIYIDRFIPDGNMTSL